MSEMVVGGSKYSDEERTQAAIHYAITGLLTKTSKATNIPQSTLSSWTKQSWWDDLIATVRSEKTQEHRAQFSKILDLAQDRMIEGMPNATAQQAAIIGGVAFDKLRLIDNQPTSITSKDSGLEAMVKKFEAIADSYNERQAKVISEQ